MVTVNKEELACVCVYMCRRGSKIGMWCVCVCDCGGVIDIGIFIRMPLEGK